MSFKNMYRKVECNTNQGAYTHKFCLLRSLWPQAHLKYPFVTAYVASLSPRCQEF